MKSGNEKAKKRNPFVACIRFFFSVILVLIILFVAAALFCMLDRKSALSVLPDDYSACLHTDSAWDAIEPLLDLQAAEVLLSSPQFVQYRQPFMTFRASPLRSNKLVSFLASREVDAALYGSADGAQHFVAAVNLSFLSIATRPLKWYAKLLAVPHVEFVAGEFYHLAYLDEKTALYIKPYKNLLIIADTPDLLAKAFQNDYEKAYTPHEYALLTKKSEESIRIVVDAAKLLSATAQGDAMLEELASLLDADMLSVVSFDITDEEIMLKTEIPLFQADAQTPLGTLITRDSTMPAVITRLSDIVQYYTILNVGTLAELKEALFPFIPADKNAENSWKTADAMCRTLFSLSINDLLFSWTGTEFAVLGAEGRSDPVFVMQVTDEKRRQEVFDKIVSSFLVNDDTSLILGGVRLPRLVFPSFIQKLLSLFDISLPSPYYMVQDGFIYFSESSESLSALYTTVNDGKRLSKNKNWNAVSKEQKSDATISLYYDLEHSVPFFLRGNDEFKQILKLYTIGRADMRLKQSVLSCQLTAVARRSGDLREIPGFPIALERTADGNLQAEYGKNPQAVFWTENGNTIKSLELSSMKQSVLALPDDCTITATNGKQKGGGVLWALSSHGAVYLLTRTLETVSGFPVILGENPTASASAYENQLVVPVQNGLLYVSDNGKITVKEHLLQGTIKAAPSVQENLIAVYDKGFTGKILLATDGAFTETNGQEKMTVAGIAYGSPAIIKEKDAWWIAFITQAGNLYIWNNYALLNDAPIKLEGVFYTNVVASGNYFYAISDNAVLYRIAKDGTYTSVAIPHATAKDAFLTVTEGQQLGMPGIYVCADGNMLYGFKENLELISGFPLAGWGIPVFADVNGDKKIDLLALTMDKKLVGWNLR